MHDTIILIQRRKLEAEGKLKEHKNDSNFFRTRLVNSKVLKCAGLWHFYLKFSGSFPNRDFPYEVWWRRTRIFRDFTIYKHSSKQIKTHLQSWKRWQFVWILFDLTCGLYNWCITKNSGTNCKAENMSTAVTKKSLCHRLDQRLRCCNFDFVDTRIELPIFFLKPRGCFTSECTVWEFVRAASIPVEWGFTVCRWLKALQSNISKSVQKRWANVVFTYVD